MIQLHKYLFGLVIVGLIAAGIAAFMSSGSSTYTPGDYNSSEIESFQKMEELNVHLNNTRSGLSEVGTESGVTDILGSFFTNAYQTALTLTKSFDLADTMVSEGVEQVPLENNYGRAVKIALSSLLIIVVFIAIFLAFITKSNRT